MPNMVLINKVTVGAGGSANITFTGIPQTYTDLVVKVSARSDGSNGTSFVYFNGDTTSNYSVRRLGGDGSSAFSNTFAFPYSLYANPSTSTASTFGNGDIYIPNYTSSTFKSVSSDMVTENNATTANAMLTAGIWNQTSAITSVTLTALSGESFVQYSTAYLYGVTNVPSSAKASGGTITSDGVYFYHTFTSSGTFTPTSALTAEILCIAGGGGAANAGGGAGGISYHSGKILPATGYTVTIGAGGAGAPVNNNATSGSNSVFSDITSNGGGADQSGTASAGGSGSGAYVGSGGATNQGNTGGATGYGNAGGNPNTNVGGGGGGAGAAGSTGGPGGAGLSTWASWATVTSTGVSGYYAGGGGTYNFGNASTTVGGIGGGGNGASTGGNGTANTGSGAGAGVTGGTGGSGIVIVRYAA
jgi:hypothetical protein